LETGAEMAESIVIVSGLSGVFGQQLSSSLMEVGIGIKGLMRDSQDDWINSLYELSSDMELSDSLLIHAAIPQSPRSKLARETYVYSTEKLFNACKQMHIKLVFVSSLSVHSKNYSTYAREKAYLENLAHSYGFQVVRIGLLDSQIEGSALQKALTEIGNNFILKALFRHSRREYYFTSATEIQNLVFDLKSGKNFGPLSYVANSSPFYLSKKEKMKTSRHNVFYEYPRDRKEPIIFDLLLRLLAKLHNPRLDTFVSFASGMSLFSKDGETLAR
jgi:hypothetical protein